MLLAKTAFFTPLSAMHCSRFSVPTRLTSASRTKPSTEARMDTIAASWNTQSTPASATVTASGSRTSPCTKRASGGTASRRPIERSSSTVTSRPRASSARTRWWPMKPAPPVTRARRNRPPGLMLRSGSTAVDLVIGGHDAARDVGRRRERGAGEQQALADGDRVGHGRAVHDHRALDAGAGVQLDALAQQVPLAEHLEVHVQEVARVAEVEVVLHDARRLHAVAVVEEDLDRVGDLVLVAQRGARRAAHGVEEDRIEQIQAAALEVRARVLRLLDHAR